MARLVRATRPADPQSPQFIKDLVDWGAGPRAGQNLILGGKAMAAMDGRFSVSLDDIRKVAVPVLRHRISTNFQAQAEGQTTESLIQQADRRDPRARRPQVRAARRGTRARGERARRSEAMATQQPVLVLGPGDHGRPVSAEEYLDGRVRGAWRYELVDGRLVVMSPNSEEHDDAAEPWRDRLVAYKLAHRDRVQKVVPEAWVRVRQGKYRIGDIGVYLVSERSVLRRPARAPELMIEVVSPGRDSEERDYVEKRAEYHAIGVLEYIIVDYLARRVLVLTSTPAGYEERVLTEADTYTSPLLPGLVIPWPRFSAADLQARRR